jgi:UDP-glucuronate 4-epimerase
MRCLVTGTAGFVGFHLARRLLGDGHEVMGIDGMVPYYDVNLKRNRHEILDRSGLFSKRECMLEDAPQIEAAFGQFKPEIVIHLAAQAGVRYSLENPASYIGSNLVGSFNILEQCRRWQPEHLVMASTSSVYGADADYPSVETAACNHPLTLYSSTKKAMEEMAHCYAHVWNIRTTAFRFFSAYGPWGRPDMAMFKFVESILADRPIDVYNHGNMQRDWTYIDDLVEAIVRLMIKPPELNKPVGRFDSLSPVAPYRVVNIGGGNSVQLMDFVGEIESAIGRKAVRNYLGMQLGDVERSEASPQLLEALTGFRPATPISVGVGEFVKWYREYYRA